MIVTSSLAIVGRGYDRLPLRIESKVSLIHKLFVETRIDRCVVVCDCLVGRWSRAGVHLLCTILEQLIQDALLLLVMNVHTFSLDGTAMRSKTPKGYQHLCKQKRDMAVTSLKVMKHDDT